MSKWGRSICGADAAVAAGGVWSCPCLPELACRDAKMPPASRKLCWLRGERICLSKGLLC